ncbi:MAG TPA: hypothetical protein VK253_02510 [Candidatus Binatia bacterium]|nr:hypothetical protein [Candidatus Binatia bacterium]
MPLTKRFTFTTKLQRGNRLQIPRYVRWLCQLETNQILKTTIQVINLWNGPQTFLTRMGKDGRITIPKLIMHLLGMEENEDRYVLHVILDPA